MATVAIDVDEVLLSYVSSLCGFYSILYDDKLPGKPILTANMFKKYHFASDLECSDEESKKLTDAFHASRVFRHIPPVLGSVGGVMALKARGYRLCVITSRELSVIEPTLRELHQLYPGIFGRSDVYFGNTYGSTGAKHTKREMCHDIGADVLIDDLPRHVLSVQEDGVKGLLCGEYPWNEGDYEGVVRARDWGEVVEKVEALID